jgi:hypothetical protein
VTIDLTQELGTRGHSRTALPQFDAAVMPQCARHRRAAEMKNPERSAAHW